MRCEECHGWGAQSFTGSGAESFTGWGAKSVTVGVPRVFQVWVGWGAQHLRGWVARICDTELSHTTDGGLVYRTIMVFSNLIFQLF